MELVQFGGQTSVNLAIPLEKELKRRTDIPTIIMGTSLQIWMLQRIGKIQLNDEEAGDQQQKGLCNFSERGFEVAARIGYLYLSGLHTYWAAGYGDSVRPE